MSATTPRVAVLVLTWNSRDELRDCLASFQHLDYPNYELVVIDNGSEDDTGLMVRRDFPRAVLIENHANLGFCKGNNVGLRWAQERDFAYVMLLNSDTKCTPSLLSELVDTMERDTRIAITGSKNVCLENEALTWGLYGTVTWGPMLVRTVGRFEPDARQNTPPMDVDWVIGNACLIRRTALDHVGLLDEEFWQCNEDVDWCYRARDAGYRVVYVDSARILHKGGASADLSRKHVFSYGYFIGRNAFMFARKHGTIPQRIRLFVSMWLGVLGRIAFFTLDNAKNAILGQRAFVRGMLDGMRGRFSPDQITVTLPARGPRAMHGIKAQIRRWLGV